MDTNTQPIKSVGRRWLLTVLLAACAGAITVLLPFGLFLVPGLWAYAMCKTRPTILALPAGIYCVLALLLYPAATALSLTVLTGAGAYLLYALQTNKRGNTNTAVAMAGLSAVCLYLAVCLPGMLSGEGAFTAIQAEMDAFTELYRQALKALPAQYAEIMPNVNSYLDAFSSSVTVLIVPVLCAVAGGMGLSNLLFFRLFSKKRVQTFGLSTLRPFRQWSIPQSMTFGLFFLLIGSFVLEMSGWEYADSLTSTVNVIVGMPLMLQGLCVVDFLIVKKGGNVAGKRVGYYLIGALLFWIAQTPLMLLGCFEQLFHFRTRLMDASKPMPPPDAFS
ncbi:MAG: DUF2232 domain-containing protein [Clostridia bacterium]